jgi:uncharacterized protein YyaL (SSP411 family)
MAAAALLSALSTFSGRAAKEALGALTQPDDPAVHLQAAEDWLRRAHDQNDDDGVSYGYSVRGGWRPSYRETSGYIATTFFDLARQRDDGDYRDRALRICRWLLSVQNSDGSFSNPRYGNEGIVFDTGQVLFGLVRAAEETGEAAFLNGAHQAASWLVNIADKNACWTRNEHLGVPHVYNTRTAWALLRINQIMPGAQWVQVARANLDWALSEQHASGFFRECAFERGVDPFTHTIAYATRGLLEAGALLNDTNFRTAAIRCADAALGQLRADGFLPGQIGIDGASSARYCCLTGNCQFSIVWAKLFDMTGDECYQSAAINATNYVMACQDIQTGNPNVRGAIAGSYPLWGGYAPFSYPNWATKFFIDAMVLRNRWER